MHTLSAAKIATGIEIHIDVKVVTQRPKGSSHNRFLSNALNTIPSAVAAVAETKSYITYYKR